MRQYLNFCVLFCLSIVVLLSCKKETVVIERNYAAPLVMTQNASIAGDDTFILKGEIKKLNDIEVIEHGFVFQKKLSNNAYEREQTIILTDKVDIGSFSKTYKLTSKPKEGDNYRYYYYLKTKLGVYKGEYTSIIINNITLPYLNTAATVGEVISLEGDFSKINTDYILVTEEHQAVIPYTISADKKKLDIKIANLKNAYHGRVIQFTLKSKIDAFGQTERRIASVKILGKLDNPKKLSYQLKDQLVISGEALPEDDNSDFLILINDHQIPYKKVIKLMEIGGLDSKPFKLGYNNGRDIVRFPEEISIDKPLASQIVFDKKAIHPRSTFSIKGYDFEYKDFEYHYLGTFSIIPNYKYGDQYTFRIADFKDGHYSYKYVSEFYEIETPTTIEVRSLKMNKPTQEEFYIGEKIHLTGSFIKGEKYYINLNDGDLMQEYACEEEGKLTVENLAGKKGRYKIGVGYEGIGGAYFPQSFEITSLGYTIYDFFPKMGYQGQLITIKGKGVHQASSVHVGEISINYNIQREQDLIKFIIPNTFQKGKVTIGVTLNNEYYQFDEKFEIL
ncbi:MULTISPECIES: IPT/TIG domain-containing protein [Sphingobacterium]|uniref:IPT/TIG domain-containing protein n=1 Tax=Sphingobacterium TaxID=28453 RepID=UPI0013ED6922|nr:MULTISPECIES: IPT/TIG domain-containing protein [Sphingobacterium]NGM71718.1 hypothetical protein [Sphingobacterium sp. SGL-16]